MNRHSLRLWLIPLLVIVSLVLAGTVLAQAPEWCVPPADGSPYGCAEITLKPDGLVGDFSEAGAPLAQAQNPARLVLPPGAHTINVLNIVSTEPGFGTLFVYREAVAYPYVNEGQVRSVTVTAQKQYIRGTLSVTCDIRNTVAGDPVGCQVTIDGVVQPDVLAAGAKKDYVLDTASHVVNVAVVGDLAALWTPAFQEKTVTINASATPVQYKPRFDKMGHLLLTLDQPGVVGDFYIDGVLAATQVPSYETWVTPSKSHRVDVKALTDPAAAGLYVWKDAATTVYLNAGQEKPVTVRLVKQWLKGFIELTCTVTNYQPGQNVFCIPSLDGAPQATMAPGAVVTYTVNPGSRRLDVTLGPVEEIQAAQPRTTTLYVTGGRTSKYNAQLTAVLPRFDITLVNNSYTAVCNVYLPVAGSPDWGADKLNGRVEPYTSRIFTVDKGAYNLYAQNCESNPLDIQYNILVAAPYTWTVIGPEVVPGPATTLTIVNNTSVALCTVFLSPPTQADWGRNWLGPDQIIMPGQSRRFLITQGYWDLAAIDCSNTAGAFRFGILITPGLSWILFDAPAYRPPDSDDAMYDALVPK